MTNEVLSLSNDTVLYETRENGRVAIITMNRPERMNAINSDLSRGVGEAWLRFRDDDEAWVAILTGAGDRAFCAGLDLVDRTQRDASGDGGPRRREPATGLPVPLAPLSESLNLWKPTIAAINGFAVAGGFMLAQQCDIRIAAEHAEVGVPEVRWNQGGPWLHDLTRQIGLGHALELVLWGDQRITAQRGYEIGWINRVVPKEQLMDEAMSWATRLLDLAPRAVRVLKETLYRGFWMDSASGRAYAGAIGSELRGMEDSIEGPRAFAEKRKPAFKNR